MSLRTQALISVVGQSVFKIVLVAVVLFILGGLAHVDWLFNVAGWAILLFGVGWIGLVCLGTGLKARYRRKLAAEFRQ
jgi:hypothetical protein